MFFLSTLGDAYNFHIIFTWFNTRNDNKAWGRIWGGSGSNENRVMGNYDEGGGGNDMVIDNGEDANIISSTTLFERADRSLVTIPTSH